MKNLCDMEKYNEHYFENGVRCGTSLYSNYRWMPELTIPMAFRMIEILDIKSGQTVLDFGCAKGFLVKSLRLLYRNAYGVDVSQYAVNNCDPSVANYIRKIDTVNDITDFGIHFDHIISKDVFEHISYDDIFIEQLKNFLQPGDLVIGISGSGNSVLQVLGSSSSLMSFVIRS